MMEKKILFRVLSRASSEEVQALADQIAAEYDITVVKEPAKTLVMLPMKEPTNGTVFYIGELLAVEAMVELCGARGMGLCMGDDFEKVLGIAIIDAAFNANVREIPYLSERLTSIEDSQREEIRIEAAMHESTKVSFKTMEGL